MLVSNQQQTLALYKAFFTLKEFERSVFNLLLMLDAALPI